MGLKNLGQQLGLLKIANQDVESLRAYANGMKAIVNEINTSWTSDADKRTILNAMNECIGEAVKLANNYATFSYNANRWLLEMDKLDKITKGMVVRSVIKIGVADIWGARNSRFSIKPADISGYADRINALGNNLSNAHSGAIRVFAGIDSLIIGRLPSQYKNAGIHAKINNLQDKNSRIARSLKQISQVYQKADNNIRSYISQVDDGKMVSARSIGSVIRDSIGGYVSPGVVMTTIGLQPVIERANELFEKMLDGKVHTETNASTETYVEDGKIGARAKAGVNVSAITAAGTVVTKWGELSGKAKIGNAGASANADVHIDKNSISASAEAEAHVSVVEVEGKFKGKYGEAEASAALLSASAKAGVNGNLSFKDGKLKGEAKAEASAEAVVAKGKAKAKVGNDNIGAEGKAEGSVLGANAKAKAGVSVDEHGNIKASAGAEANAYLAKGEVKGQINLFGIKIQAGVEGEIGLQAKAKGEVGSSSAGASVGLGPLGANVKVDWSGLKKNISKIKLW